MIVAGKGLEMDARRIVVGVDGSHASRQALRWALGEARARGTDHTVHLLHVTPLEYVAALTGEAIAPVEDATATERGRQVLEKMKAQAAADGYTDVSVTTQQLTGNVAASLLKASHDADLLVVGSRGHGGFTGLLLGSTAQACVAHASCPVTVVPAPEGTTTGQRL